MIALLIVMWILVAVLLFLLKDARQDNKKLKNTIKDNRHRYIVLLDENISLLDENISLQARLQELNAYASDMNKKNELLRFKYDTLNRDLLSSHKLRWETQEENDRLRKELAELKPQLTRAEAAVVNFKSLYDGVGSVDEEWHNTFGVSSPEEEKRLIASMSAYLAKEIDDEIQRVYLHNPYSGRFRCGLN